MRTPTIILFLLILSFGALPGSAYSREADSAPPKTASSPPAAAAQTGRQNKSAILDIEKLGLNGATDEQIKEAESVYESCIGNTDTRRSVDCKCLAAKFLGLRMKRGPGPAKNNLVAEVTRNSCRNVAGITRMEYESCMTGTGFNYGGIQPEDYCECYANEWARLLSEHEGRLDEDKKSTTSGRTGAIAMPLPHTRSRRTSSGRWRGCLKEAGGGWWWKAWPAAWG